MKTESNLLTGNMPIPECGYPVRAIGFEKFLQLCYLTACHKNIYVVIPRDDVFIKICSKKGPRSYPIYNPVVAADAIKFLE